MPPEITTQNKKDSTMQVPTEPTTVSVNEPNKVVKAYSHKTTGCKQGEYLPSNYCHKVSSY